MILYNGDCREIFGALTSSKNNIVVVSDPPFNIGYKYKSYKDKMPTDEYLDMMNLVFGNHSSVVIHYPEVLYKIAFAIGKVPERVCSWVYNSNTPRQHRDVAFFDITPKFTQVKQPYKNPNDKRIKERIAKGCAGSKLYDWWNINQVKNTNKEKTEHPCQMPVEVMCNIIGILPPNSIIIDPFMGSGTTGVAVKLMNEKQNANREFVGIEMDESYYDIAVERIKNYEN